MEKELLISTYPHFYHMAEFGSIESIKKHGLLSVSALLDLFEITGYDRDKLEKFNRPGHVTIKHPEHGSTLIRDQKPTFDSKLGLCLTDNLTPPEWYVLVNSMVFFWPTKDRLKRFLGAAGYKDRYQTIITVSAEKLVNSQGDNIRLSPVNSGCTRSIDHMRGHSTFLKIEEYDFEASRKKRNKKNAIAEIAVIHSVPNIEDIIVSVETVRGPGNVDSLP